MRCEEIQDLILTDYVDEELSDEQKAFIDVHLESCSDCRALAGEVHQLSHQYAREADEVHISQEAVWQKIRKNNEAEKNQGSLSDRLADLIEKIKGLIAMPRPAFALVTVMVVLIGIVSLMPFAGRSRNAAINVEDQIRYLASLTGSLDEIDVNFGTDIEKFLL